jgi:hypothetical protein
MPQRCGSKFIRAAAGEKASCRNADIPITKTEGRSNRDEIGLEQVRLALQTKELLPVNDIAIAWRWMRDQEGEIAGRQRRIGRNRRHCRNNGSDS